MYGGISLVFVYLYLEVDFYVLAMVDLNVFVFGNCKWMELAWCLVTLYEIGWGFGQCAYRWDWFGLCESRWD